MQRNLASGFDDSFRRHLAVEQRRAVLDTIARELTPETTLGDIVDAAQDLGWGDSLGELRLADLAGALLGAAQSPAREGPVRAAVVADAGHAHDDHDDEDENDDEDARELADELDAASAVADEKDDEVEQDEEDQQEARETPKAARARKAAAKTAAKAAAKAAARIEAPRKPSSLDRALDRIDKALAARKSKPEPRSTAKAKAPPPAAKKAAAAAKKVPAKKLSKKAPVPRPMDDDDNDAMSLDQAAKVLVPLVRKLKEATMQDLEEQTGMGRRKLRFHIGQLVKHGRLKRHGMGRGTCYTVK